MEKVVLLRWLLKCYFTKFGKLASGPVTKTNIHRCHLKKNIYLTKCNTHDTIKNKIKIVWASMSHSTAIMHDSQLALELISCNTFFQGNVKNK